MTDELLAKFEEYIEQLRERAANLLGSPTSHRHMGKSEGYTDCADELQALLDAHFASRDAEVEALKRDAERYRWLRAATNRDWTIGKDSEKGGVYQYYGQDVDATIDAAMAKESGE